MKMTKMLKFTKAPEFKKRPKYMIMIEISLEISLCWRPKSGCFPKVRSSYGPLAYFARNENIGKICKRTTTWTDFNEILAFSSLCICQFGQNTWDMFLWIFSETFTWSPLFVIVKCDSLIVIWEWGSFKKNINYYFGIPPCYIPYFRGNYSFLNLALCKLD